jgi:dimethylhistidine N-methyltransferase
MMDKPVVSNHELLSDALDGLTATPKRMHPKWFYDHAGSEIFEQITELPEYYPTRTEVSILRDEVETLARYVPDGAALIELGSGASTKTRLLLDALPGLAAYVPVDVSGEFLQSVAGALDEVYPDLTVSPVVGDFLGGLALPAGVEDRPKVAFFPGSTIGNLEPHEARALLGRVRAWPRVTAFVLGVDLVKAPGTLVRAYDDSAGVTARFNRNLLHRLNAEAGADFEVERFAHEARWNAPAARVEMHLVSEAPQTVRLGGQSIAFAEGESIHTESSHKYTRSAIDGMAADTGWRVAEFVTDADGLFAIVALVPQG